MPNKIFKLLRQEMADTVTADRINGPHRREDRVIDAERYLALLDRILAAAQ